MYFSTSHLSPLLDTQLVGVGTAWKPQRGLTLGRSHADYEGERLRAVAQPWRSGKDLRGAGLLESWAETSFLDFPVLAFSKPPTCPVSSYVHPKYRDMRSQIQAS